MVKCAVRPCKNDTGKHTKLKSSITFHRTMSTHMRLAEKEITIKAPWGNIAALSWGDPSSPPAILCHGKLDACSGFRPLVSLLPKNFYYVSIDLPGNGRSDHLPKGVRYTVIDLVPTIVKVMEHFKWDKFVYIGHSLGVPIGKFFNIAYPGHITRMVELDPIPAHHTWPTTLDGINKWYHDYYGYYKNERYAKYNGGEENIPVYTYESARERMMKVRGLTESAADHVLERCLEPIGKELYRFTFDQRMKEVTILPFSGQLLQKLYTQIKTPTFCVLAKAMIELGMYVDVPFVMDEKAWPHNNYKFKIVEGGHDVHIYNPDCMAEDISHFLLNEFKAKL